MERKAIVNRKTKETDISVELKLDNLNESEISTGVPFFDHMLTSMSKHGRFCLKLKCNGDYEIDDHHSVEDVGITLGQAFYQALGQKEGIVRFGDSTVPMDEALAMSSIDVSGRPFFRYKGEKLKGYIKKYSEELTIEFLRSFAMNAKINLHVNLINGDNGHHIHEAIFKSLGLSLYKATKIESSLEGKIQSTKGAI